MKNRSSNGADTTLGSVAAGMHGDIRSASRTNMMWMCWQDASRPPGGRTRP
jgi:hypothetical protein